MIRLTFRRLALALAAVAGLAVGNSAKADIVIDTFNEPLISTYQIGQFDASPFSATPFLLPNGLTRNLSVVVVAPAIPNFNSASGSIGGGTYSLNTDNNTVANATLNYTGFGAGTNDFTSGTGIRLDFSNLNPGNTPTAVAPDMPISVSIATGSGTLTQSVGATGGPFFTVLLPFASFSGTGDLANVTGLSVTLNGGPDARIASDFEIDNIVVPTNAVPAPPAFALILAAAPVIALRRWKAKKTA